jgi:hypothetical protein
MKVPVRSRPGASAVTRINMPGKASNRPSTVSRDGAVSLIRTGAKTLASRSAQKKTEGETPVR